MRYIKVGVFLLAALSVLDIMTSVNGIGRYQFRDFNHPELFRTFADLLLLGSLLFLSVRQWTQHRQGIGYWLSAFFYCLFIIFDINSWLFLITQSVHIPLYILVLVIQTLPLLVISEELDVDFSWSWSIGGVIAMALAFIVQMQLVDLTDPTFEITDEIIERQFLFCKIVGWLYYLGIVVLILVVKKRYLNKKNSAQPL